MTPDLALNTPISQVQKLTPGQLADHLLPTHTPSLQENTAQVLCGAGWRAGA
jgi:hypothetical protein